MRVNSWFLLLVTGVVRTTKVLGPLAVSIAMFLGLDAPMAQAKTKSSSLNIIPAITNIIFINGQIVASGVASAVVKGKAVNATFSGVPIDVALAADQSGAGACPALQLRLSPITVNLAGLTVETAPICFTAATIDTRGLLGELLCTMGNLLRGGLTLRQIMQGESVRDPVTGAVIIPGINGSQYNLLLSDLTAIYNDSLARFPGADLASVTLVPIIINLTETENLAVLEFEYAPGPISAFGVNLFRDDCNGGPVSLAITATPEAGLLGSQLASLAANGKLQVHGTLTDVLNQLLALSAF